TEAHIPEDDPRNPATIADNVGDNVGDVAGLGSDLLESYVGAIAAAVIFVSYVFYYSVKDGLYFNEDMITSLLYFPIAFAAIGVFACILGIAFVIFKKASDKPHRELNFALWLSAALIIAGGAGLSLLTFGKYEARDFAAIGFKVGALSPWLGAVIGIVSGIAIGMFAEYFTSADYKPTRRVALSSMEGPALTITSGMALGMKSTLMPVLILAAATIGSNAVGGLFGVAMAATGMLSFVAATVSVDTYGPIADNAGGISEMCNLEPEVREITDKLDSVGNTTAAIGKGFAIGSAALAALSLLSSFMHSFHDDGNPLAPSLDIINPLTLAGCFVGAALPYLFSGMLIEAVGTSARKMVAEIRNQFHEHPGILDGTEDPDYNRCIQISATGALSEMKMPVLVAVGVPVLAGFLFGPYLVGGLLVGATASAIMLALYTANAGGAWDNGKKHIEQGGLEDAQKGDDTHAAAVIGDTVGDPLKDTVGPSLDILIKIMATVSLIAVSVFSRYNLSDAFGWFR
ncbi:MAG: sodium-translocating pyrophosphatase, partial [Clostridiaceae bacterium]|nr:sodium-translocating pyrophosphatase [Clostridiaceae bacterium]